MVKQKITLNQKNKLLDLLTSKPQLRSGKFSTTFTHQQARKEWEEIAVILNSIPGAQKEWKAWRKTWQDILSKTKSKSAAINKARRGTGGGPPPPDSLDEFEEGVTALLHPHSISGHSESVESTATFEEVAVIPLDSLENIEPTSWDVQIIDEVVPPPSQFSEVSAISSTSMPPRVQPPPSPPKIVTQKQGKVNVRSLLKEKINLKKQELEQRKNFYDAFIKNMERQAKALEDISNAFQQQKNSTQNSNTDSQVSSQSFNNSAQNTITDSQFSSQSFPSSCNGTNLGLSRII